MARRPCARFYGRRFLVQPPHRSRNDPPHGAVVCTYSRPAVPAIRQNLYPRSTHEFFERRMSCSGTAAKIHRVLAATGLDDAGVLDSGLTA